MAKPGGLDNIIVSETDICMAGGNDDDLLYRGYSIHDLVDHSSFEEVAHLLICGHMPDKTELKNFKEKIKLYSQLPEPIEELLKIMPKNSNVMDVLKTSVSFLGQLAKKENSISENGIILLAVIPTIIASWQMIRNGLPKVSASPELTFSGNLLFMITGKVPPDEAMIAAFDKSLILYAEHEYNASTFSARLTTSTLSDVYSGVSSAIGTLKGSLHGGANEKAMEMILKLSSEDDISKWLTDALANKTKIMGFGHRVYKNGDLRAKIIKKYFIDMADRREKNDLVRITQSIEDFMVNTKGIHPNLDFYSAPLYYILDIPINLYTPIFVVSRITGWMAHIKEQLENNRLIRPASCYTGPKKRKLDS